MNKEILNKMIIEMVELQNSFNNATNGNDWLSGIASNGKKIDWTLCADLETSELIESLPYKHWKDTNKDNVDINNVKIEAVDIWHFLMSYMMADLYNDERFNQEDYISKTIEYIFKILLKDEDNNYIDTIEELDKNVYTGGYEGILTESIMFKRAMYNNDIITMLNRFIHLILVIHGFDRAHNQGSFTMYDIYKLYIGKNALNKLRQNNGYKDGTYVKMWNGEEDNVTMQLIINDMSIEEVTFDTVLKKLETFYEGV